jgi:hypothetical protein
MAARRSWESPDIDDDASPLLKAAAHPMHTREDDDGERQIVAPSNVSHDDVAVRGSGLVTNQMQVPNAPKAVVQYTIVFDEPEQQRRWYDFIKWLRNEAAYDGDTTAGKLISFIDAHSEC